MTSFDFYSGGGAGAPSSGYGTAPTSAPSAYKTWKPVATGPTPPPSDPKSAGRLGANMKLLVQLAILGAVSLVVCAFMHVGPFARPSHLHAVDTVAGLTKFPGESVHQYRESAKNMNKKGLHGAVIGVYGVEGAKQASLIIAGGTLDNPGKFKRELGKAFSDVAPDVGFSLRPPTAFTSGAKGGELLCGAVSVRDGAMSYCSWIDQTTAGFALVLSTGLPGEAANLVNRVRIDMES